MNNIVVGGVSLAGAKTYDADESRAKADKKKRTREEREAGEAAAAHVEASRAVMEAMVETASKRREQAAQRKADKAAGVKTPGRREKATTSERLKKKVVQKAKRRQTKASKMRASADRLVAEYHHAVATKEDMYRRQFFRAFGENPEEGAPAVSVDALDAALRTSTLLHNDDGDIVRVAAGKRVKPVPVTDKDNLITNMKASWMEAGQLPSVETVLRSLGPHVDTGPLAPLNLPAVLRKLPFPAHASFAPGSSVFGVNGGLVFPAAAMEGLGAASKLFESLGALRSHVTFPTEMGCTPDHLVFVASRAAPGLMDGNVLTDAGAAFIARGRRVDAEFMMRFHTGADGVSKKATMDAAGPVNTALGMDATTWSCCGRTVAGLVADVIRSNLDALGDRSPVVQNMSRVMAILSVMLEPVKYATAAALDQCRAAMQSWLTDAQGLTPALRKQLTRAMTHATGKGKALPRGGNNPCAAAQARSLAVAIGNAGDLVALIGGAWDITSAITPDLSDVLTASGMTKDGQPVAGVLLGKPTEAPPEANDAYLRALHMDRVADSARSLITRLADAAKAYKTTAGPVFNVPDMSAVQLASDFIVAMRKFTSRCLQTVQLFRVVRCRLTSLASLLEKYADGDWTGMRAAYLRVYFYDRLNRASVRRTGFNAGSVYVPNCIMAAMGEGALLLNEAIRREADYRKQHRRFTKESGNTLAPSIGSNSGRVMAYTKWRIANPDAPEPHTAKDAIPGGVDAGCVAWQTISSSRADLDATMSTWTGSRVLAECLDVIGRSSEILSGMTINGMTGVTMRQVSSASLVDVGMNDIITRRVVERAKTVEKARRRREGKVDDEDADAGADPTPDEVRIITAATAPKMATGDAVLLNVRNGRTKSGAERKRSPNTTAWVELLVVPPPGLKGPMQFPIMVTIQLKSISAGSKALAADDDDDEKVSPPGATPSGKRRRTGDTTAAEVDPGHDEEEDDAPATPTGKGKGKGKAKAKAARGTKRVRGAAKKAAPRKYRLSITTRNTGPGVEALIRIAVSTFLSPVLHRVLPDGTHCAPKVKDSKTISRMVNLHNPGVDFRLESLTSVLKLGVMMSRSAPATGGVMGLITSMASGTGPAVTTRVFPKFIWFRAGRTPGGISVVMFLNVDGVDYRPTVVNVFASNMNIPGSGGPMLKTVAGRVVQALALVAHQQGDNMFTSEPLPPEEWDPLHVVNFAPIHDGEVAKEGVSTDDTKMKGRPADAARLRVSVRDPMPTLVARVRHALGIGPPVVAAGPPVPVAEYYQPT